MTEQTDSQPKSSVASKIAKIMAEIKGIEKGTVQFQSNGRNVKYGAYSIDSIVDVLRPLMGEHGLAVIPQVTGVNGGMAQFLFTLADADSDDTRDCMWFSPMNTGNGAVKDMGATISYALKNFLMRTFMVSPPGDDDLDFTPPSGSDGKNKPSGNQSGTKTQGSKSKKPASSTKGQSTLNLAGRKDDRKIIAESPGVKDMYKIRVDGSVRGTQKKRWIGYAKVDGLDFTFTLWDNQMQLIDGVLGLELGTMEKIGSGESNERVFSVPISVTTEWHIPERGKGGFPIMRSAVEGFNSPAVVEMFIKNNPDSTVDELKTMLDVADLTDYKGTLAMAMQAVADYQKAQKTIDGTTAFQLSVDKVKQKQLIDVAPHQRVGN